MELTKAYDILYIGVMFVLILLIIGCLFRTIRGPEITDRIVSVNMTGTFAIMFIAILAVRMEESYLLDVALIYAMISFLAVVVLTKVYQSVHEKQKTKDRKKR